MWGAGGVLTTRKLHVREAAASQHPAAGVPPSLRLLKRPAAWSCIIKPRAGISPETERRWLESVFVFFTGLQKVWGHKPSWGLTQITVSYSVTDQLSATIVIVRQAAWRCTQWFVSVGGNWLTPNLVFPLVCVWCVAGFRCFSLSLLSIYVWHWATTQVNRLHVTDQPHMLKCYAFLWNISTADKRREVVSMMDGRVIVFSPVSLFSVSPTRLSETFSLWFLESVSCFLWCFTLLESWESADCCAGMFGAVRAVWFKTRADLASIAFHCWKK